MKKFYLNLLSLIILIVLTLPAITFAENDSSGPLGLIVCSGATDCGFPELIKLFYKGIDALVKIATLVTVVALIAMGLKLMTAGGKPGELVEIRKRAKWIVVGYVCIIGAWLFVYTILKAISKDSFIFLGN